MKNPIVDGRPVFPAYLPFLVLVVMLALAHPLKAQDSVIDSLKNLLPGQ